ncbi:hypothetical protein [Caulobacter sp. NIBR2454]|uniref:hypothetical protein n=1 Tax=Caulobacter sp. NIBR2454 TaxID=3015996 RepID=UPI0022B702E6|nr:hypothetical protein [Caulobacter sp. NIBR2454]
MLSRVLLVSAILATPALAQVEIDVPTAGAPYAVVRAGDSRKDCGQLKSEIDALNARADEPQKKLDAMVDGYATKGLPGDSRNLIGNPATAMIVGSGMVPGKAVQAAAIASMMTSFAVETRKQDALRAESVALQPLRDRARHLWNLGQGKTCGLPVLPEDDFTIVEDVPD